MSKETGSSPAGQQGAPRLPPMEAVKTEENALGGDSDTSDAASAGEKPEVAETQDASTSDSDGAHDKRKNPRRDRKIRALNRALRRAEEDKAAQAEELKQLRERIEAMEGSGQKPKKPLREDFEDDDAWAEALVSWKKTSPKPASKSAPRVNKARAERLEAERKQWATSGTEQLGDRFAKALQAQIPVTVETADHVLKSPIGHEVYVYLTENPGVAEELAMLSDSPADLAEAFAEVSADVKKALQGRDKNGRYASGKNTTKAPKPTPAPARQQTGPKGDDFERLQNLQVGTHKDLDPYMKELKRNELRRRGLLRE